MGEENGAILEPLEEDDSCTLDLNLDQEYILELPEGLGYSAARLHGVGARPNQEDVFAVSECENGLAEKRGVLFLLADGMGGMMDGEKASAAGVASCLDFFDNVSEKGFYPGWMRDMAFQANQDTIQALGDTAGKGGSTLVAVHIQGNEANWITVGDSHLYLFRDKQLVQLNKDHNLATKLARMVSEGLMSREDAESHPQRRALTSYLGIEDEMEIDGNDSPLQLSPEDVMFLSSDGVFGTLSDEEMANVLDMPVGRAAMSLALQIEGRQKPRQDNYTGILIHLE